MTSKLTPGATYIYERVGSDIYAREEGKLERRLIGKTYDSKDIYAQLQDGQLWYDIRRTAETNPTLQKALQNAILIYKLAKENFNE